MEEMEFNSDQELHEKYSKDTCHLWSLMLNRQSENIRFPAEDPHVMGNHLILRAVIVLYLCFSL